MASGNFMFFVSCGSWDRNVGPVPKYPSNTEHHSAERRVDTRLRELAHVARERERERKSRDILHLLPNSVHVPLRIKLFFRAVGHVLFLIALEGRPVAIAFRYHEHAGPFRS